MLIIVVHRSTQMEASSPPDKAQERRYLAGTILKDQSSWTLPWSDLPKIFGKVRFGLWPTKKSGLAWRNKKSKLLWMICDFVCILLCCFMLLKVCLMYIFVVVLHGYLVVLSNSDHNCLVFEYPLVCVPFRCIKWFLNTHLYVHSFLKCNFSLEQIVNFRS